MSLSVYSASAGSGKTHHLTFEYLKLAFSNEEAFRHILAITFTNKATEEMKTRIITELSKISSGQSTALFSSLKKEFSEMNEVRLRMKAQQVLRNILYSYHFFNITTIDSFFQQIMRIFTREMGVQIGYNIRLDSHEVLAEAVDSLLAATGKNRELTEWMLDFTNELLQEDKSWDLKYQMKGLSAEILKEKFSEYSAWLYRFLSDKNNIKSFSKNICTNSWQLCAGVWCCCTSCYDRFLYTISVFILDISVEIKS